MTALIYDTIMGNGAPIDIEAVSMQEVDLNRDTITFSYMGKHVRIKIAVSDDVYSS